MMKKQIVVDLIDSIRTVSTALEGENMNAKKVREALKDLGDNRSFKQLLKSIEKAN
jgi:hypothetical protein